MNHVGFAYELPQNAKPKRRETQTSEQERKNQKDVVPLVKQDIVMRTPTRLTTATSDLRNVRIAVGRQRRRASWIPEVGS